MRRHEAMIFSPSLTASSGKSLRVLVPSRNVYNNPMQNCNGRNKGQVTPEMWSMTFIFAAVEILQLYSLYEGLQPYGKHYVEVRLLQVRIVCV